jgi:hypothetical protein
MELWIRLIITVKGKVEYKAQTPYRCLFMGIRSTTTQNPTLEDTRIYGTWATRFIEYEHRKFEQLRSDLVQVQIDELVVLYNWQLGRPRHMARKMDHIDIKQC